MENAKYLPACGFHFLTPFYDSFVRIFLPEAKIRGRFIELAKIAENERVLDIGCGTGTLAIMIKNVHPTATVVGIDPDPRILKIAARKSRKTGLPVTFDHGFAFQLPYPDNSFHHVLSTFVFHHLTVANKRRALQEAFRILHPQGGLLIADFTKPNKNLAAMVADADFKKTQELFFFKTMFGAMSVWDAQRL
jgi:ubiquinone/menaquinone biosynthesis C-methylase UbiE